MDTFLSAIFAGTSHGAIYALAALGLVLVWRGAGVVNFALPGIDDVSKFTLVVGVVPSILFSNSLWVVHSTIQSELTHD